MAQRGPTPNRTPADRRARSAPARALQATRDFLSRPRFWLLIGTGIALTAVSGPVYTIQHLTLPLRVFYWATIILTAGLLQTYLTLLARQLEATRPLHWAAGSVLATLVSLPPVYALTWGLNLQLIGEIAVSNPSKLLLFVGLPMLLINLLVAATLPAESPDAGQIPAPGPAADFAPRFEGPPPPGPRPLPPAESEAALPPPLLFEKLPRALGRDLICLRAQDHYIEAITPRGRAQVLMRLSDAERELGGFDGLRVHRSWWVNLDHVTGFGRTGAGGMELTTTNGLTIPVSRGQRSALRAALDQRRRAAE